MSKKVRRPGIVAERMLEFAQMFNRVMVLDDEFTRQLPAHEFELRFDETGSIYIDGKPLGVNVKQRHRALRLHGSRRP